MIEAGSRSANVSSAEKRDILQGIARASKVTLLGITYVMVLNSYLTPYLVCDMS